MLHQVLKHTVTSAVLNKSRVPAQSRCKVVLPVALCNQGLLHHPSCYFALDECTLEQNFLQAFVSTHLSRIGPIASLSAREQFAWNPSRLFFFKARRRKSPGSSASLESSSYASFEQQSTENIQHCWCRTSPEAYMIKICPISIRLTVR